MVDKKCTSRTGGPESDGRTRQAQEMPHKWSEVIGLMVLGGLDFQPAMEAAGYSESYANANGHKIKKDDRFCEALKAKRAKIANKSENRREKRLKTLDKIIDDPDSVDRDIISAVQVQGKMCGWLSETIKHETTERQNMLDSANQKEAARLAILSLDTRQLPEMSQGRKAVDSTIIDFKGSEDSTVDSGLDENTQEMDSQDVDDDSMSPPSDTVVFPIN